MHEDDLKEFVQAGIRADEDPLWFGQPQFSSIWQREYTSRVTRLLLLCGILAVVLNIVAFLFFGLSTILNIFLIIALGVVTLRLCWIYYLGRRLVYVLTSKRLVFFLESAKPIEYKSFFLSKLDKPELVKGSDGYDDVVLSDLGDGLWGVPDGDKVVTLILAGSVEKDILI